jgi:hypothetical protein
VVVGKRGGVAEAGTWALVDHDLTIRFDGGGSEERTTWRARVERDHLVLWNAQSAWGKVYGRAGAAFTGDAGPPAAAGPTSHTIAGVNYTIALPADFRLTRDDNGRQTWSPPGEGLVVNLTVSPRPQSLVNGSSVTQPCDGASGILGSGGEIGGVEREISVGTATCLGAGEISLGCSVEHTRGWLEAGEKDEAVAMCRSIAVQ